MRKAICIVMVVLFLATIITGTAEAHVHPGTSGIHTVIAVLFIISTFTHIIINRKPLARHFVAHTMKLL